MVCVSGEVGSSEGTKVTDLATYETGGNVYDRTCTYETIGNVYDNSLVPKLGFHVWPVLIDFSIGKMHDFVSLWQLDYNHLYDIMETDGQWFGRETDACWWQGWLSYGTSYYPWNFMPALFNVTG